MESVMVGRRFHWGDAELELDQDRRLQCPNSSVKHRRIANISNTLPEIDTGVDNSGPEADRSI